MKKQKANDTKTDDFLLNHLQKDIIPFGVDHRDKLGFVQVFVNDDYTIGSMEFIEGPFERESFHKWDNETNQYSYTDEVSDVFNVYFEILYRATKMKIMFFRTYIIRHKTDYSRF
jgi:hypothetical protein